MAALCSRTASRAAVDGIPLFLAPAFLRLPSIKPKAASFSTTSPCQGRKRDGNKKRGVSALRRTGPKFPLSVSKEPLPRPVLDPGKRSKLTVREDHGLWDFFGPEKKAMLPPEEMASYGRAWTLSELRYKSFEDLHSLWWVSLKEMNRLNTLENERDRVKAGYGANEAADRKATVRATMRSIKWVLTERWYAWEDAKRIERNDPERAAELMGVPLDSFVDAELEDETLPIEKSLDPSEIEEDPARRIPSKNLNRE